MEGAQIFGPLAACMNDFGPFAKYQKHDDNPSVGHFGVLYTIRGKIHSSYHVSSLPCCWEIA